MKLILTWILKTWTDIIESRHSLASVFYTEPSGSIKDAQFLDEMRDIQLPKTASCC